MSLLGVLAGKSTSLDERWLYFQWHRGDEPVRDRACAVRGPRYKLVQPAGQGDRDQFTPEWSLYDLAADPGEEHNVIDQHPDVAAEMKQAYERWFDDVGSTRGYPPPRIVAGTTHENPLTLTRQDWRGPRAGWRDDGLGYWQVEFAVGGAYDVTVRMPATDVASQVRLRIGSSNLSQPLVAGAARATFRSVQLEPGAARVEAVVVRDGREAGAHYVDIQCLKPATAP